MQINSVINNILLKTNGGRDLIVECHPEFRDVADECMAKLRGEERCASAHIHRMGDKYILKDFGDGAKGKDGIEVYAETHNMTIKEAVHALAVRYGIENDNGCSFGPRIETRPLTGSLRYGEKEFEFRSDFTSGELRFLAPKATTEILHQLGWHSVARIISCKDDREIVISSTPAYPIFARDMYDEATGNLIGRKIYQPRFMPKDDGRNYKFTYYPAGMQPGSYIHGLYELQQVVKDAGKVENVVITSGERDAIVAKSMGYYPIWFNSETKEIPSALFCRLQTLAKHIFYIPDIDATGKAMAMKNLKLYPQLRTVWLPESITSKMGDQHKACKDLRDWAEIYPDKKDFEYLINTARSYQFWEFDEDGKPYICNDSLLYFLNMNGYWRIKNDIVNEYEFIHVYDHVVTPVKPEDIRLFYMKWCETQKKAIRNLLLKSRTKWMDLLKDLAVMSIDFQSATSNSQVFCFQNKQIMVTDEDIYAIDKENAYYFWEKQVIRHNVELLPPMFDVKEYADAEGRKAFAVIPTYGTCKLFMVLIRTSMIYWEKREHGGQLTEKEELEENRSLSAKMFAFGHLIHRYREKSRDWAPVSLDNNTKLDSKVAEGGSAKTFLFSDVLTHMGYDVIIYNAKDKNPLKDDFMFDQMTPDTDVFVIDEIPDGFEYDKMNSYITGTITVNKKNKARFDIPYRQAPKLAFISNFPIHDFGGSASRRQMPLTYSDYYHYASPTNGHTTTRTIKDDFGMVLMGDDYSEEDWNRDLNFALQCEQFYLRAVSELNDKITPDLTRVLQRHNYSQFTESFDSWAVEYFGSSENLNCDKVAEVMLNSYNRSGRLPLLEKKEFKSMLKAWVGCQDGLEFNPLVVCNDKKNRRIKCEYLGRTSEKFHIAGEYQGY